MICVHETHVIPTLNNIRQKKRQGLGPINTENGLVVVRGCKVVKMVKAVKRCKFPVIK